MVAAGTVMEPNGIHVEGSEFEHTVTAKGEN